LPRCSFLPRVSPTTMSAADAATGTVDVATIGPCTRLLWAVFKVATDGAYAAAAGPLSSATAAVDRFIATRAGPAAAAAAAGAGWVVAAAAAAARCAPRAVASSGRAAVAAAAATAPGARLGAAAARLCRDWLSDAGLRAEPMRQVWAAVRGDPATQLLGTGTDAPSRGGGGRPRAHGRRACRRGGARQALLVASAVPHWLLLCACTGTDLCLFTLCLGVTFPRVVCLFSGEGCAPSLAALALVLAPQSSAAWSASTCS